MCNDVSSINNCKMNDFYRFFKYHDDPYAAIVLDDILETEYFRVLFFSPSNEQPFSDEIEKFASIIFDPEDVIETRLIPSKKSTSKDKIIHFGKAKELSGFANKLHILSSEGCGFNVYVSINPRISKYGGGTAKNVLFARCIFVDFDHLTVDEALKRLIEAKLPRPTLIVNSGKGCHFYWKLMEALTDLEFWKKIQNQFIRTLGSDPSITDTPRVMRLPSFKNINHPSSPLCYIYEENRDLIYNLQELIDCLPESSDPLETEIKKQKLPDSESKSLLVEITGDNFQRAKSYSDTFFPVDKNRNKSYFKRALDLFKKFNLTEEQTFYLLSDVNEKQDTPLDAEELRDLVKNANTFMIEHNIERGFEKVPVEEERIEKNFTEIPLSEARNQMVENRIKSLSDTGVFFDGSPPGTGKSTADIDAIKKSKTSLTVLPTHDACNEFATRLLQAGITASVYPKLSADTCKLYGTNENFGLAKKTQSSGLNVGTSICLKCEFSNSCTYQKTRRNAKDSNHTITTHARIEATDFASFEGKEIVFIHENPLNLICPFVEIDSVDYLNDLLTICLHARKMVSIWNDTFADDFLETLESGIKELIAILDNDPFFNEFATATKEKLMGLSKIKNLPLRHKKSVYENGDYILFQAMNKLNKHSNSNALHLAIAYSFGNLKSLYAKVEDYLGSGGQRYIRNFLVGFWKVEIPKQLIWFEDGSFDAKMLENLTGLNVVDKTPIGKVKNQIEPIQFTQKDITQKTSPETFKSILRGILAKYKHCKNIGIICHRCHVSAVDSLSEYWKNRIKKISYFHSGEDRASNDWLNCDLLIVLGTPRVPPSATRNLLLSFGKVDAAKFDSDFVLFGWKGRNEKGEIIEIVGRKYLDSDWNWANSFLVKETLNQAIGRARSITPKAIPVVLVSTEPLGLVLSGDGFQEINQSEDCTLQVVLIASSVHLSNDGTIKLSDKSANRDILGNLAPKSVTSEEVKNQLSNANLRNIQRHMKKFVELGLLVKVAERKGYRINLP